MLKTKFKKILSCIISIVLIAAIALMTYGCSDKKAKTDVSETTSTTQNSSVKEIGQGERTFSLKVTDLNGNSTDFSVKTDKQTVGDALLELNLIEGETSQYGLYVKKVNSIEADYDKDGTFWGFYIDGKMAMSGVDTTDITNGSSYELRISK